MIGFGKGATVICAMMAGFLALATAPAKAGWFDDSKSAAPAASTETLSQIQRALDDQRYLDAGNLLDQALVAYGADPKLVLLAGNLNLARGRFEAALTNFKTVDTKPEVRAGALEGEGLALLLLGRSDDALPVLESAVAANPAAWHAWNALGTVYDRAHEWAKAEAAYDRALSASGGSALVLNNRGFSRLSHDQLDDAAADFIAALKKKPDLASARNNLRLAIAMKGDYARAIEGASTGDRAAVLNNAGFAAMARGDYPQAETLLAQAIQAKGEYYALAAANLEMVHGLESSGGLGEVHGAAP